MKIPAVEREKIFAGHIPDKELVSKVYNTMAKTTTKNNAIKDCQQT